MHNTNPQTRKTLCQFLPVPNSEYARYDGPSMAEHWAPPSIPPSTLFLPPFTLSLANLRTQRRP
jgi:hypothetical protein